MRRRRNRVVLDTPDRQAHREAVVTVARLQRKLAEVRDAMARTIRRSARKPVFNLAAWVGRRSDDIIVDDPVESTCTPGDVEAVYRRLLDLRLKAPPNVYGKES